MLPYKYIISLAVFVVALLAVNTVPASEVYASYAPANKSHNLVLGNRMPGDRLLYKEHIVKGSLWLKIVTVERTYNASTWERITMIEALDKDTNGNGAYASILNGGLGHSNVTIGLKSQKSHGINFIIQLYGR